MERWHLVLGNSVTIPSQISAVYVSAKTSGCTVAHKGKMGGRKKEYPSWGRGAGIAHLTGAETDGQTGAQVCTKRSVTIFQFPAKSTAPWIEDKGRHQIGAPLIQAMPPPSGDRPDA